MLLSYFFSQNSVEGVSPVANNQAAGLVTDVLSPAAKFSNKQALSSQALETKAPDCVSAQTYEQSAELAVVEQWMFDNFGLARIDQENYMDEAQLLSQAKADNYYAMFILGLNYRWHSTKDTFQSQAVRPSELPKQTYKDRPFDIETAKKARYWAERAAVNGIIEGLTVIDASYLEEVTFLEEHNPQDMDKIQQTRLTGLAYIRLQGWLAPGVFDGKAYQETTGLSVEESEHFKGIFADVSQQWAVKRQALGYDSALNLNIPPEFYQLKNMKTCEK